MGKTAVFAVLCCLLVAGSADGQVACDLSAPPQCPGSCAAGQVCQAGAPGTCQCVAVQCDASAPACNGQCPNTDEVCVADLTGCHCAPAPPCNTSAPACAGPCSNPGETCVPDGQIPVTSCHCEPPPPCVQTAPACDGSCSNPGQICLADAAGCHCGILCTSTIPNCVGECPVAGQVCQKDLFLPICECVTPCENTAPACNGDCLSPAQHCVEQDNGDCACVNPPPPCMQSAPACDGTCQNPNEACLQDNSSDPPSCYCGPAPCNAIAPHMCAGACPLPGQICQTSPLDLCECVTPPTCQQGPFPTCAGPCPANFGCTAAQTACLCCPMIPPPEPVGGVSWTSKQIIIWNPPPPPPPNHCPKWWNVYRITALRLTDADGNGVADSYGEPYQCDLMETTATDGSVPAEGLVHFYQVTEENPNGEGPMGNASNGLPRPNVSHCP